MITNYDNICAICGRKKQHTHHLVFGRGLRDLADADDLRIPICLSCHEVIHQNGVASALSKILGQVAWENEYMYDHNNETVSYAQAKEHARTMFMLRYGRSWI